jgi:anti-anti-sigma factor
VIQIRVPPELVRPSEGDQLRALLEAYLDPPGSDVEIDLVDVDYLGSSVIATLLTFVRKLREGQGKARIRVRSKDVHRTLKLTRVDQLVEVLVDTG